MYFYMNHCFILVYVFSIDETNIIIIFTREVKKTYDIITQKIYIEHTDKLMLCVKKQICQNAYFLFVTDAHFQP